MAIKIDTTGPLRRPSQLHELVTAVLGAGGHDESDWLEWKSSLDLTAKEGQFSISRTVLGFANRMPDSAGKTSGGLGYMVVGAEPGKVTGVTGVDGAELDQSLSRYLGNDGPLWSSTYIPIENKTVLVVTVEAPSWGDPFHTLRKTFGTSAEGTIFVRRQARTVPATAADIRKLQDRLVAGQSAPEIGDLAVSYTVRNHLGGFALTPGASLEGWLDARRQLIESNPSRYDVSKIEEHLRACSRVVPKAAMANAMEIKVNLFRFTVHNPTAQNLTEAELVLTTDRDHWAHAHDNTFEADPIPKPPRAAAPVKPTTGNLSASSWAGSHLSMPSYSLPSLAPIKFPDQWIDTEKTSTNLTIALRIGDIRPHKSEKSTSFHIFVLSDGHETLELDWAITAKNLNGHQTGSLTVPATHTIPFSALASPT